MMTSDKTSRFRRGRLVLRYGGIGLLLVGAGLLTIAALGHWTGLGDYVSQPARSWELFDRTLVERTPTIEALYQAAEQKHGGNLSDLPPQEALQVLFETASARFTHGETQHTPFSNWILWVLGRAHPALGAIRDPGVLLKRGESAFCSEVSYVLMQLAQRTGVRSRHVGLNGHVVMEAWYGGEWHMYDPDFEVVVQDSSGSVMSMAALSRDEALVRKAYKGKPGSSLNLERVVKIITSRDDNSFVSYPPGSQFEWKTQVLLRIEQTVEILKFAIPAIMILLGGLLAARKKITRAPSPLNLSPAPDLSAPCGKNWGTP